MLFCYGGKEVLLKTVAQAIPTYSLSVFRLPPGLCSELKRMVANYWWVHSSSSKGIHCFGGGLFANQKQEEEWAFEI